MKQIGSLKCLDLGSPANTSRSNESVTYAIVLHGFGADAYDLQTISEALETRYPLHWIFPQGPLEVPIGPGWTGRAWWSIDIEALNRAMLSGSPRDLSQTVPEGLIAARNRVFSLIAALKVPWSQIVLAGFSQGAMLATDVFLSAPETPKGLMIFSGALINKEEWKESALKHQGARFFQSHGKNDSVLSLKGAQQLETLLTQNGLSGRLLTFNGAHEIPLNVIEEAGKYLNSLSK
jgi:phospholipase/carboxylesterase